METRAHHVLIGLFSVIVIGAALLFGLWLAKSGSEGKFNYYDIVFNEAVSGLSQGSSVQYSGIKVGDVAFLRLDPQDPRKVWARIRVVASAPIKQDTTAKLALTGITGTSIIQLSSGTPASPMLEGKDGKIPVIVATPSPLTQLLSNGEDLMGNINQLIARFSNLLSEENTARISRTLDHLDQATGALSAERENVSSVMQQLAQASRQANAALAQASELMRSANGLLNEQGKGMLENANKTMASLERTSATLDQLISENRHSLDGGIQGLSELGPAVSELRDTLAALRGISRRLEENPANYLLGREKTKEFTP
ncbi:TPA: MCE family protein [Pseudomonas aeruginosa]|nr:MCE family protein [Pseudomonas aeruginosa]